MSLLFKNYTKFKPKKDLQLQIKTVLFKRGALQQEQQQWWSNQWTLEPNIFGGGGGWSPRRAVRWQSEHDAIIIVQLDRASASSAKKALTRELRGIFADKNSVEYSPHSLPQQPEEDGGMDSTKVVGWIPTKVDSTKVDPSKEMQLQLFNIWWSFKASPSLLCVRVCWDSWIRKWVCWMSDRI